MRIEGECIYLRKVREDDVEDILKWENDREVWEVSENREEFSRADIEAFIRSGHDLDRENQLRLMICDKRSDRNLGCIDLFDYDALHKRAGLGILIYEKNDRRKGYARESIALLLQYCLNEWSMKQLYCNVLENNEASLSLFESCGFKKTGTKSSWRKVGDEWLDEHILQFILHT